METLQHPRAGNNSSLLARVKTTGLSGRSPGSIENASRVGVVPTPQPLKSGS